jgi:hypothetical protein
MGALAALLIALGVAVFVLIIGSILLLMAKR